MAHKKSASAETTAVQASFVHEGRTYESRLVNCGKRNCSYCHPPDLLPRPTHGPYWYLCGTRNGRWSRIYLGKNLDTSRYVNDDGSIDWEHAKRPHSTRGRPPNLGAIPPGQLDALDELTLQEAPTDET